MVKPPPRRASSALATSAPQDVGNSSGDRFPLACDLELIGRVLPLRAAGDDIHLTAQDRHRPAVHPL